MKNLKLIVLNIFLLFVSKTEAKTFKGEQLKFKRVRTAYLNKELYIKNILAENEIDINNFEIYLRVFKKEEELEVWVKNKEDQVFKLLKTYKFSANSGDLGPKRIEGDGQIPEGFYFIDRFNPSSNFYLSLGINYPNKSDKYFADKKSPGGDIFIHGSDVTIGCVPITDDKIEEVYLLAIEASNNGQKKIPVHIFPFKFTKKNIKKIVNNYLQHKTFWWNIKLGYEYFEEENVMPEIHIKNNGEYSLKKNKIEEN